MLAFVDVVQSVIDLTQTVSDFFNVGIYDLLTKFVAWCIKWYLVAWVKAKITGLTFAWAVAQELITSLDLATYLNAAWSALDSRVLSMLVFFRVPEAVNLLLSAAVTKFVFRILGF